MPHLAVCNSRHVSEVRVAGTVVNILLGYAQAFSKCEFHDYFKSFLDWSGKQLAEQLLQKLAPKAFRLMLDSSIQMLATFSGRGRNIIRTLKFIARFGK